MCMIYHFCILDNYVRIDIALHEVLYISRSQIIQLIESKLIKVNDIIVKKSRALKKGDIIQIYAIKKNNKLNDCVEIPNDFHIEIIHETNDYVIFNKPRDLVVHHAPSVFGFTLTDYLKINNYKLSTINDDLRFGIVHRLDKDTSGAILVAKNNDSHLLFANMLKNRTMGRVYICIINKPLKDNMFIECFIGRNPNNRLKMAKLDKARFPYARDSKSEFRKIAQSKNNEFELIGVRLYSGRTHQIRVHLSSIDRYIYGDTLYSPEKLKNNYKTKMLLHAKLLYFNGMVFSAKLPKDLLKFLKENFVDYEYKLESCLKKWQNEL